MKITVFNGSPKGRHGNTSIIVENFLKGAEEAGAVVEQVFLSTFKIKACTSCKSCWEKTPGECATKDDMTLLVPKFLGSDIVGFASPVFVDNVTGIMKNFIDRLIVIGDPHWTKDENGECRHLMRYNKPDKMLVFSNSGFPEQSHFQVLRLFYKRMARNLGWKIAGEVYRGGGALMMSKDPNFLPFLEKYKALLRKAGCEVTTDGIISETTASELEKPMLPVPDLTDLFIERVNQICDERLKKFEKN